MESKTSYVVVSRVGEAEWKPVYVYEFTAQEAASYHQATQYDLKEVAVQAKDLLKQLAELNGLNATYAVREFTITITEVE